MTETSTLKAGEISAISSNGDDNIGMTNNNTVAQTTPTADVAEKMRWADLGKPVWVKVAVITALIGWLYWGEFYRLIWAWTTDSSWSHGFIIPAFSLYFLNQRKKDILTIETKPNYLGLALLLLCIVIYPLNLVWFKVAYARQIIVLITVGAIVLFLGGWRLIKYTWLPITYLIFAIPLPDRYYKMATMPMRQIAADFSTAVLNFVPHLEATANGVVIDIVYNGKRLEPALDVAEACSGMRLLMAFLALGVAMAYLHYRPAWQRGILLLSTVPIAIFCNMVRVTTTAFIYVLLDPKYAQGAYHDMLGMAMLPLAFGLYGLLAWFMSSLFLDEDSTQPTGEVIIKRKSA